MTIHGILIPDQIAATNIDSLTRSAVSAVSIDNGNLVVLTTYGAASGNAEVWTGATPATTTPGLTDVWMAYDPEIVWTGSYRGLDPDLRNFYTPATRVYSVFKPQLDDVFTLSTNGIAGTIGVNTFINCTNTGGLQPEWAASAGSSVFAAKLIATTYISLGMGSIDSNRVVTYQFRVVAL
jgi:hypothetical protein